MTADPKVNGLTRKRLASAVLELRPVMAFPHATDLLEHGGADALIGDLR
ncbi:hypothetical protein [Micromonospora sonneratiae]|uniref:Uncharacterized protein n=1 Tax=Micromonospora sonneratiae TaxID=1184706 RepID=A0ABW3YKN7_9ACTN